MKRLEYSRQYSRQIRSVPGHRKNSAEAVMVLAHVTRERHRLVQERLSLAKRMQRIDKRLIAIAGAETRLVPAIQAAPPVVPVSPTMPRAPLPAGVTQVTLQY